MSGIESKEVFRDLTYDGKPSGCREFRRKVVLSVASLEEKSVHLAGPRLFNQLSGEAIVESAVWRSLPWKATEHLNVAELRTKTGWLLVLKTLDKHYRFLPES